MKKKIRELTKVEKFYIDGHKLTPDEFSDHIGVDIEIIKQYLESRKTASKIKDYITTTEGGKGGVTAATPVSAEHPQTKIKPNESQHVFRREN